MIEAEALAAVTGLWPVRPISKQTMEGASGILRRWNSKISSFVDGKKGRFSWTAPPKEERLHADLTQEISADDIEKWVGKIAIGEVAVAYIGVITEARKLLSSMWAPVSVDGMVAAVLPLSMDSLAKMWTLTQAIDDPDTVFEDLVSHALTAEQIGVFSATYPELYRMSQGMLTDAIVSKVAAGRRLSWQQESMIRVFFGNKPSDPIVIKYPDKAATPPPPSDLAIDFDVYKTASQRTRNG